MGGSAAQFNNFWQLFVRPAAGGRWKLVTPPGMASNGGFILAAPAGQSLITAFRPSQLITYSPLISTADAGAHWSTGHVAAGLADVPDALATGPAYDSVIALAPGVVQLSHQGGAGWARLATLRSLAAAAAGRTCRRGDSPPLPSVPPGSPWSRGPAPGPAWPGYSPSRGASGGRPGPPCRPSLASQPVTVLRLSTTGGRETALLAVGSQPKATVVAAWTGSGSDRWVLSPVARTQGRHVLSASFGPGGSVGLVLSGDRGEILSGPGGSWRELPALPSGTQTLALGSGSRIEALAAHRSAMTVWGTSSASPGWTREQAINVPIQYGSSS